MRVWCVGLLVLLVSMAGCLESEGDEGVERESDVTTATGPTVLPWSLEECRAIIAVLPAEVSAVAPLLPDGFVPMSMEEMLGTGTSTGAAGEANFGIEALDCASGAGLNGSIDEMVYGSYFIGVHPPEEMAEDVTYHFVKLDTLVPDGDRRAFLQEHGLPAVAGTANAAFAAGAIAAGSIRGSVTLGNATHALEASGVAYTNPTGSFVEFTATPQGLALWRAQFTWADVYAGPATVDVADGSTAAEVLGAGEVEGAAFLGTATFHEASLTLPGSDNATTPA